MANFADYQHITDEIALQNRFVLHCYVRISVPITTAHKNELKCNELYSTF